MSVTSVTRNSTYITSSNNRNPFIDYPDWADIIWGDAGGYANPDKPNGIEGGDVTTLKLSTSNFEIIGFIYPELFLHQ